MSVAGACVCGNAVRQIAISYLSVVTAKLSCVVHGSGARRATGYRAGGVKSAAIYRAQLVNDVRLRAVTAPCPAGRFR
jgi:hypothetical protein